MEEAPGPTQLQRRTGEQIVTTLRVMSASSTLKKTVETGLVDGVIASLLGLLVFAPFGAGMVGLLHRLRRR